MDRPFDAFAATYDATFTHTALGRMLRSRVWAVIEDLLQTRVAQTVLDVACGTGEDALWLARQGLRVTAVDSSLAMLAAARAKVAQAGVGDRVQTIQLDITDIEVQASRVVETYAGGGHGRFDGVLSNFGGLNVLHAWRPLARFLAQVMQPGGWAVLAPMGPFCPWELGWYLLHGDAVTAVRRWRQPATAMIGNTAAPVWYPSARRLRADFSPWFRHLHTESLGLWLPPSALAHLVERWPRPFAWLDRLEQRTARLTGGWGDHYIAVFERSSEPPA